MTTEQTDDKAMLDATCPKCNRRIGWYGTVLDRPACRHCGHQIDRAALQADHDQVAEFRRLLALAPHQASGTDLRAQRIAAGLTLRQAALRLQISGLDLSRIESGIDRPDEKLATRMGNVYDVGPDAESEP